MYAANILHTYLPTALCKFGLTFFPCCAMLTLNALSYYYISFLSPVMPLSTWHIHECIMSPSLCYNNVL
uniref:Uncharacterized protein n=2 Tax=Anguilla anguilla TaxID=7936 RepID=A0A0E9U0L8_ANGAN